MKKIITSILCMALSMVMLFSFAGCFGNDSPEDTTPKEYTIQYTDDSGTHQITVTAGMPYALDVVPEKTGYTFAGLFDAEVGGTQYVSASGASLSPFNDGKNMVLFPQFKAKDYTVVLDYQGATVTGSRQLTVAYGSSLPELPKNLTSEHKEFAGWYTKANCEGTQIADEYGLIPVVSVLNDTNFDLSGEYVYLYAGFEIEKFTVTCCFEAGMDTEDVQVEYDTPVSQIVPNTRVNGEAPLTWSKTQDGEVWNGKVTDDIVLYAVEYAPVIDFDSNGGNKVNAVVARAGSTIALPTPTKDMAKFAYWEDMQGNKYDSTTMPSKSISLKAVWQAKLVFDENGGSDVDDISVAAGNKITLPTPKKDGFIFAGWYTAEKEQYTSTTMPSVGIALKAGWYKANNKTIVVVDSNTNKSFGSGGSVTTKLYPNFNINCSAFLPSDYNGYISIEAHIKIKYSVSSSTPYLTFGYYYQNMASTTYLLFDTTFDVTSTSYKDFTFSKTTIMKGNVLFCAASTNGYIAQFGISDYYVNVNYPETTNLYL